MKWIPRRMRHKHEWVLVGSSLSGWNLYICIDCGKKDIG